MIMNKNVKIGIGIAVLIFLAVAGYSWYNESNKPAEDDKFIKTVERNLSTADRKIFEDRLVEAQNKLTASKTDEERFGWQMQIGYNLQALGRLGQAQDAFEQAIRLKSDDYSGLTALFQVQIDRSDNEGALVSIKTALDKSPNNPDLWRKYIQLETEKFNPSNDSLNNLYLEALSKTNDSVNIITVYAQFLEKVGEVTKSIEYWQKAIDANPASKKLYQTEIDRINKLLK